MGEEDPKSVEKGQVALPETAPPPAQLEAVKDVAEEKAPIPLTAVEKTNDTKALVVVEKVEDPSAMKNLVGSAERVEALARVEAEKRLTLIKAWEENEKIKADNKAFKKLKSITAWENSKKATVEAELKRKEEEIEKKKAENTEKMENKISLLHKAAEEKRAMVEARHGEELLKAEEVAAKYRSSGLGPKKLLGCFGA